MKPQKISSIDLREKAYLVFVRPLLEYASSVWDPYTKRNINKIEAIQRRAARFVPNRYHNTSSVSAMLDRVHWPTLQQKQKSARLAMLWKINNNMVHADLIQSKLLPLSKWQRRFHDQQFVEIQCRTQYRQFSFLPRSIREWNELPPEAVVAHTLDTFVSRVS